MLGEVGDVDSKVGVGPRARFRALGSTVLPAGAVRGLAGLLLVGAVGMPWLAGWQGVLAEPQGELVVEGEAKVMELRPELVRVPGGRFVMGSPEGEEGRRTDEQQHEADVGNLEVCRTEVTQGQWKTVMGTVPFVWGCGYGCGEEYPVHLVSWNDAVEFMNRLTERENALLEVGSRRTLCYEKDGESWGWTNRSCTGYRLPTETEWEYLARAGTTTAYSFGDSAKELCKHGNGPDQALKASDLKAADYFAEKGWSFLECADGVSGLAEVKSYQSNPWGLYDVYGNVSEWVWDWYGEEYPSQPTPEGYAGPDEGERHVLRGGSFWFTPESSRSAYRGGALPPNLAGDFGFRCVRNSTCPTSRHWRSMSDTEIDTTGLQGNQTIDQGVQISFRDSAGQLQFRICKTGESPFINDIKVAVYDGATDSKVGALVTELATANRTCSEWQDISGEEDYPEGGVFGAIWNVVSPSGSADEWQQWGICAAREYLVGKTSPTGTCWSGIDITLIRTCARVHYRN